MDPNLVLYEEPHSDPQRRKIISIEIGVFGTSTASVWAHFAAHMLAISYFWILTLLPSNLKLFGSLFFHGCNHGF